MAEARKAEWAEKKRIEWEKARPATKLEQAIIAADKKAGRDDALFATELGQAGIALARVTANDVKALDALRQEQDIALMTAAAEPDSPAQRRIGIFAPVSEGELCVVTKLGDVIPLNQQHMAALENRDFPSPAPASSKSTELVAGDPKSSCGFAERDRRAVRVRDQRRIAARVLAGDQRRPRHRPAERARPARDARSKQRQAIDRQEAITGSLQEAKQGDHRRRRAGGRHRRPAPRPAFSAASAKR